MTNPLTLDAYGDVLFPEDIMTILHLSRNTVYSCLRNGEIPSKRIGKKYIIPKQLLGNWFSNNGKENTR